LWSSVSGLQPAVVAALMDDFAFPEALAHVRRVADAVSAYLVAVNRNGGVPQPPLLLTAAAAIKSVMGTLGFRTLGGASVAGSPSVAEGMSAAETASPDGTVPAAVSHFAAFRQSVREAALGGVRSKDADERTAALKRVLSQCDTARNVTFPQSLGWELKDQPSGPVLTRKH